MIHFHLAICWICRRYERQIKTIGLAFQSLAAQKGQVAFTPEFKNRLVAHLMR
jgi:hypothetical protein